MMLVVQCIFILMLAFMLVGLGCMIFKVRRSLNDVNATIARSQETLTQANETLDQFNQQLDTMQKTVDRVHDVFKKDSLLLTGSLFGKLFKKKKKK